MHSWFVGEASWCTCISSNNIWTHPWDITYVSTRWDIISSYTMLSSNQLTIYVLYKLSISYRWDNICIIHETIQPQWSKCIPSTSVKYIAPPEGHWLNIFKYLDRNRCVATLSFGRIQSLHRLSPGYWGVTVRTTYIGSCGYLDESLDVIGIDRARASRSRTPQYDHTVNDGWWFLD